MLRDKIETLPDPGARWLSTKVIPEYGTPTLPITMFYRSPMEAVAYLLANPNFRDGMSFAPYRRWGYDADGDHERQYAEMASGKYWWRMQASESVLLRFYTA